MSTPGGAGPGRPPARRRFAWTLAGLVGLAVPASGLLSPPATVSQLLVLAPGLALAVDLAYWLTYRAGWRTLGVRPTREVSSNRPLVFFGAFLLAVVVTSRVAGAALPRGEVPVAAVGVVVASWLAYFDGYDRLRGVGGRRPGA